MKNKDYSILIVEDETDLRLSFAEMLSIVCPKVRLATNGEEALQELAANPDVIAVMSDINMPKMTGLELLAKLRANFNTIPFVILTGCGDDQNLKEAVRLNATDFLSKPILGEKLISVMENAFQYGVKLSEANSEIEKLISEKKLADSEADAFRRLQRTLFSMRIQSSVYLKPNKKTG